MGERSSHAIALLTADEWWLDRQVLKTTDNDIPEGKIISRIVGGKDALNLSLEKLKKFEFTGYLRSVLEHDDFTSVGYFFVKDGSLIMALHGNKIKGKFTPVRFGEEAQKLTWVDSYDTECEIEVHGRVEIDDVVNRYPNAKVKSVPKISIKKKRLTKFSLAWGAEKGEGIENEFPEELPGKLEQWRSQGFIVKSLEDLPKDDVAEMERQFAQFEDNVNRVEFLKNELESLDLSGHEAELDRIKALLKNPTKVTAIEAAVQDLRLIARSKETEEEEIEDMELGPAMSSYGSIIPQEQEDDGQCNVCGAEMRGKTECPTCGAKESETTKQRIRTVTEPTKEGDLIAGFTFDSFVVGESNRFSQAAATAVSKVQSSAYNPLLICSGAGLGKTHLLNAIGNFVARNSTNKKVLYISTEAFINEFIEATKANKMAAFRKKYRNLDFLLLDDVHFIAEQEAVQDELFHTFNALYKKGKQIVMTSDRQIKDVPGIKDRLVSRFEAGLVTDIQSPAFETRVAILRKKVERYGIVIDDDVLVLIARNYAKNIRKLEGALNKVMAYSELMKVPPTPESAKEALKEEPPDAPEEPQPIPTVPIEPGFEILKIGHSYLIEEEKPVKCFELFVNNLNMGMKGLGLIRLNPKRVREDFDVGDATMLWLTDREGDSEARILPVLERIIYKIENFLNMPGKSILLIDGLDYLISNNSFDAVLSFLRRLIDEVSESDCVFIMSLTPETIDEQGLKILEREMEIISFM